MSTNNYFQYFPIDTDAKEIRLLLIAPAEESETLSCALIAANVLDPPAYKALSYTWGTSSATRSINLDGTTFFIRRNLEIAMRRFRDVDEEVLIWIDAICINQNDFDERSRHVTYMHNVYQEAEMVLIWLGSETDESTLAIEELKRRWNQLEQQAKTSSNQDEMERSISVAAAQLKNSSLVNAIGDIFGRLWWSRVWTMQEFICAKNLTFFVGSAHISLEPFRLMVNMIRPFDSFYSLSSRDLMNWRASLHFDFLFKSRLSRQNSMGTTLVQTLISTRDRISTDPRDKIFTMLNIIPESEWPLRPDYSKAPDVIFTAVARHILHTSQRLTLLSLCERSVLTHEQTHLRQSLKLTALPGLPSWVPNWTRDKITEPLPGGYDRPGDQLDEGARFSYSADGGSLASFGVSTDDKVLVVSGIVYDSVKECFPPWIQNHVTTRQHFLQPSSYHVLERWILARVDMDSYPRLSSHGELLWRTLVANRFDTKEAATAKDVEEFVRWRASENNSTIPSNFIESLVRTIDHRRLFVTERGLLGLGPFETTPGDMVCVLLGSSVPMIIQNINPVCIKQTDLCEKHQNAYDCMEHGCLKGKLFEGENRINILKGESYVHGIMEGQVMHELEKGSVILETIEIH